MVVRTSDEISRRGACDATPVISGEGSSAILSLRAPPCLEVSSLLSWDSGSVQWTYRLARSSCAPWGICNVEKSSPNNLAAPWLHEHLNSSSLPTPLVMLARLIRASRSTLVGTLSPKMRLRLASTVKACSLEQSS